MSCFLALPLSGLLTDAGSMRVVPGAGCGGSMVEWFILPLTTAPVVPDTLTHGLVGFSPLL